MINMYNLHGPDMVHSVPRGVPVDDRGPIGMIYCVYSSHTIHTLLFIYYDSIFVFLGFCG